MYVCIRPARVLRALVFTILALGLANLIIAILRTTTGHGYLWGMGALFDAGAESSIPTWYSIAILLLAAILNFVIAVARKRVGDPYTRHWQGLSMLFLYLSLDEGCMIHERIGSIFVRLVGHAGIGRMGWTAPFIIVTVIVAGLYARFVRDLPAATRRLFFLAGAVYVGSALVLELIGGVISSHMGQTNLASVMLSTIEEPGEMLGVTVLIYALLSYMSQHIPQLEASIQDEERGLPSARDERLLSLYRSPNQ